MKKLFWSVAIVCVAMLCMTSCSNKDEVVNDVSADGNNCWKGTLSITYKSVDDYGDVQKSEEKGKFYTWGTKKEVTDAMEDFKKAMEDYYDLMGEKCEVSYTIEKSDYSESSCEEKSDFTDIEDLKDWDEI